MGYVLSNGIFYTEKGAVQGHIIIEGKQIDSISPGEYTGPLECHDLAGRHVLPGFIDIHIHGGYGEDFMDADLMGLHHLSHSLLSEGTTSYLATTMTQSEEAITTALSTLKEYHTRQSEQDAEMLGIHLEGPYISEFKVGAQNPDFVQRPSVNNILRLQESAGQLIKIITFAPEVEGADKVLETLHHDIIFSMGHTVATFDEMNKAASHGARHITHLYNAATPFEHRSPGAFGAAWTNEALSTEIIVDGIHSHPAAVDIAYRLKGPERMFLITDAMRAKGMADGTYDLGGQNVIVKNHSARLADGTLAGSILKMNEGLKNLIAYTDRSIEELWRVTSFNQAQSLGISDRKGSIKQGKDADLVVLDQEFNVSMTIKSGHLHHFN
ncbi:N-acetylglucosamine-6-phosphate deacetylase [Macrococcus hajekii]|uniref:N-acetylglucosamine-6-phosphate deacetylase n=1 Tax=Macrococcus hajekii TaxID=198482 RepID=A0A4R6BMY1_9STAP|nr:N-acetylglucosamine-6-phosphate deacetylase [Macrococcus hajekii]TDM03203.1 N-acetylglucosamine-6-phosphate deacetylase [Macrococcus hajekii]GGA96853.1 N-acetylglucosamine-6-phosphate deacetylase [Macrococcus hajekii]